MQFIGHCEGAAVYVAEHVIVPREHGGSLADEVAASVRKYTKRACEGLSEDEAAKVTPVVILTHAQLRKVQEQSEEAEARHARETKRAKEKQRPLPAPLPPPAIEIASELDVAQADPAPAAEHADPAPVEGVGMVPSGA